MPDETGSSVTIELSREQLGLVIAALRLLLASEEDVDEIRQIKALLARLPAPAG